MNATAMKKFVDGRAISVSVMAPMLGMSRYSLYKKIEGKSEFKVSEMRKFIELTRMTDEEVQEIFFG
jgi:predicted transcriptional regulator